MSEPRAPNLVFVLTDDQGYADLGCTGNPWISTPNIDRFHGECVRFPDYHAQPLCTPTRGAIMSARRPIRNGAWATCWGRSILRRTETTMADVFRHNGYRTGMFGKWHLGDNYPFRPQDRGFEHVVAHKGGGVGQTPDFWGNNYFDDTYFANGEPASYDGYCTDVWFAEALTFIEDHRDEPFFCYIATNAPHSPYLVADRYAAPYRQNPDIVSPEFYGMITNIDENFGRLRTKLAELGLEDNTILIFMTDNGSSGGSTLDRNSFVTGGYNAGMRGKKGSYYDGGHRVPLLVRWPERGIQGGRDIGELVCDVDLLPTFADLCGLDVPEHQPWDGMSVAGLFDGSVTELPDRTHILQIRQSTDPPNKWQNCVMTRRWRLVGGRELYDIEADPGQRDDIAAQHPEVVTALRQELEAWWEDVSPSFDDLCGIVLGNDAENPTRLCAMDVMGDVAWNQCHITEALKSTGVWNVDVEQTGTYRFEVRRWPDEVGLPIDAALPRREADKLAPYQASFECNAIHPEQVRLRIFDTDYVSPVDATARDVTFELELNRTGRTTLEAWFADADGEEYGAYYVTVARV